MRIITIPHPTLRQKAAPVTKVDKKLQSFVKNLGQTLERSNKPKGVGLAANQVDKKIAVFSTFLPDDSGKQSEIRIFINPKIVDQSDKMITGANPSDKKPFEEGCLSMPKLYGAVPRFSWVRLEFDEIAGNELKTRVELFENVFARIVQHELDHLHGILFSDHSLKFGLPVFKEVTPDRWEEVDPELLKLF